MIQKIPLRRAALFALTLLFTTHFASACTESTAKMPTITYPETKRVDVAEKHFGQTIADPYRWLENDVRNDKEVAAWVESQNKVTNAYLNTLPGRDIFKDRLKQLYNYERFSIPVKKGGQYFYLYNSGLQNQQVLYVRDSVDGAGRVLIDPNSWAKDGATALAEWSASDDGKRVAYAVQEGGSDWRTIRVLDVNTGKVLNDEIKWARLPSIAWVKDGSGFFYTRFPEPKQGEAFQAGVENQTVYFHAIGTPQAQDRLVYATPDQPTLVHNVDITADGRYVTILSTPVSATNTLTVVDLQSADWKPRKLVDNLDDEWSVVGNVGTKFFLTTSQNAPRLKVVTMNIAAADPVITDVVPEQDSVLGNASLVGGRLLISHRVDVKTEIRRYTLDGKADGVVKLPGIGTAGGFKSEQGNPETFFVFTSYNTPGTIYRYDVASNTARVWAQPKVAIDLNRIAVEQRFYRSKDGTRVPMFIIRRKDVTRPAPTLLYAYGGYGIPMLPAFSPEPLGWVEQGGVYAIANIRGGSEYGKAWHEAGRRQKKQNVFDDFIAAGEYLKAQSITPQNGLAIQGGSNGGLLIGAVVNQRPDLFAAALPQVGVMDMLRFDKFTGGKLWVDEYGSVAREADFRNLFSYSPYHNIQSGKAYPAILATTADTDDRVVPSHTFKYVAALQAADIGDKPHLVRIETRAGHGAGKPTDKIIEETADMWAFAAHWTGLDVGDGK
ncbi:prolyl oligopeptidase family serine peptidase [Nostoc sp. ChiQUE01b]|uniref:prolyl oligopeptidase family serine peptidase n=1 Tax=Nostoc sp. ChiQUE01b TaxID=3075376 RepID=UPI002AD430CA|nr:prolyl oligopeptidase family serine peptidase [Nostoc sp. ChiQUE01b]MDZ8257636.1 prolyl oligopeptidase family serine peptidase [Nostoc sp. ChiQUE01b]